MSELHTLALHERMMIGDSAAVLRVPGGWLYGTKYGVCFVPFNKEFGPKKATKDDLPKNICADVLEAYHRLLPELPEVRSLTAKRKAAIRARARDSLPTISDWEAYFRDAARKPFLFGKNQRGWVANFDFFLREDTIAGMQEGKYG